MFEAEGVEVLSTSKVYNLDGVEVGHHDVVGLEVQVEDTAVVEVLDSLEDLDQVTSHVVLGVTEPVNEAVQQLFARAVLRHQHQIARRDIGFVQSHDLFVVEGFQDLVLLQDFLLVLLVVGDDLGHVDFACGVLAALSDDSKTTPGFLIQESVRFLWHPLS